MSSSAAKSGDTTLPRAPSHRAPPVVPSTVVAGEQLLRRLATLRHGLLLPLARLAAGLCSGWVASFHRDKEDFAREQLGRSARWLQDLVRLQRTLDKLPRLAAAISGADGGEPMGQVAALVIGRVATPENVERWIARARSSTLAALRQQLATTTAGDRAPSVASDERTKDETPHVRLQLSLPPEVAAAHDSVLELHRAVAGWNAGATGFAEALIGEASGAGWNPPDAFRPRPAAAGAAWLATGASFSTRKSTNATPASSIGAAAGAGDFAGIPGSPAAKRGLRTLAEFHRLQERSEALLESLVPAKAQGEACERRLASSRQTIQGLVGVLQELIRFQNRLEIAAGELLLELHEHRAWPLLGFAGLEAYAEERLGLGRSTARSRVSLARQLRRRPVVHEAYSAGKVGTAAAHWLGRVLANPSTPGTPERWIEHASTTAVKRLLDEERLWRREQLLSRAEVAQAMTPNKELQAEAPGPAAQAPAPNPAPQSARRFPCAATVAAARGQRPEPVDDATWQASLLLVRGMTQERIFGLGQQLLERLARNGPLVPVNLHLHLPPEIAAALRGYVEAARRELTARAHAPALEEIQRPSARMAAIFVQRGERVPEWVAYLALLEECACVWDPPAQGRRSRTARTLERDGYRCMAPGCTARSQLQVHHVRYRSAGGGDEPENLLTLCMHHHQYGEHGGLGHCRGRAPLDVIWCVGSGEHATWWRNERRLQAPP